MREYSACVDDITLTTTGELAPLVMAKLKETLEKQSVEVRTDKCTAHCPTPGIADNIQEEAGTIGEMDAERLHDLGNGQ